MQPESFAEIDVVEPEWTWQSRIPTAGLALVAGMAGIGKGYLLADWIARVTRGDMWPDGSDGPLAGNAVMVSPEEDPNSVTTYKLRAAGARMGNVYNAADSFTIPSGIPALTQMIQEIGNVRLVTIDPLAEVSEIALTSSGPVRIRSQIMRPLQRMALNTGAAVVLIQHTLLNGKIAGSKALTDSARIVLRVKRADSDPNIRLIQVEKNNLASDQIGDVAYTIGGPWPTTAVSYLNCPPEAQSPTPSTSARVIEVLAQSDVPLSTQDVAAAASISYGNARTTISRLSDNSDSMVYSPTRGLWTVRRGVIQGEIV